MSKRGPKSAAGKAGIRLNAVRHGVFATDIVVPGLEQADDWVAFRDETLEELAPVGVLETTLAEYIAATLWRRRRIPPAEAQIIAVALERAGAEYARQAAYREKPRSLEEASALLEGTLACANLIEALPAMSGDTPLAAAHCAEALSAATEGDDELLVELPGVPASCPIEAFPGWTADQLRRSLDVVAARLECSPDALMAAVRERLADGVARRRSDLEETRAEIDRIRRERLLPSDPGLGRILRMEAHLNRVLYRDLSELLLMQARRRGEPVSITRLQVHGFSG